MFIIVGIFMWIDLFPKRDLYKFGEGYSADYVICLIMAIIFVIVGILFIFLRGRKKKLLQRLKTDGDLVYADYVETITNYNFKVMGRSPFVIICNWTSPYDGKEYIFKSENLWEDPTEIIESRSIQSFPVYITRERVKPYVMDVSILENFTL